MDNYDERESFYLINLSLSLWRCVSQLCRWVWIFRRDFRPDLHDTNHFAETWNIISFPRFHGNREDRSGSCCNIGESPTPQWRNSSITITTFAMLGCVFVHWQRSGYSTPKPNHPAFSNPAFTVLCIYRKRSKRRVYGIITRKLSGNINWTFNVMVRSIVKLTNTVFSHTNN